MKNEARLILFLCYFFCSCHSELLDNGHEVGERIPSMNLQLADSISSMNIRSLPKDRSVIVIFFDPYCDFCQTEIRSVLKEWHKFSKSSMLLVTPASLSDMRKFADTFELSKYSNVSIARDRDREFLKLFEVRKFPYTCVYSEGQKLKKIFFSAVGTEALLNSLRE